MYIARYPTNLDWSGQFVNEFFLYLITNYCKVMSLIIQRVFNSNKPEQEFVRLYADIDEKLKGYALVDKTFDNKGNASNEFRHIFLFPDLEVKAGEYIRVYTGNGKYKSEKNANNVIVHYLYWNSDECVWNDKQPDEAILIKFYLKSRKKIGED